MGSKTVRLDMLQNLEFVVPSFRLVGHDDLDGYITLGTGVKNKKEP
jgi:hypothetical protein